MNFSGYASLIALLLQSINQALQPSLQLIPSTAPQINTQLFMHDGRDSFGQ